MSLLSSERLQIEAPDGGNRQLAVAFLGHLLVLCSGLSCQLLCLLLPEQHLLLGVDFVEARPLLQAHPLLKRHLLHT